MTSEFAIAVHTLVFLNHKGICLNSETIAENVCTHPARLRKVLAKLKKAGLLETREGMEGGYCFVRKPEKVTLDMVCLALGVRPVNVTKKTGDVDMNCLIASGMGAVMDGIYERMNRQCYQELQTISIAEINDHIFAGEEKKGADYEGI